MALPVLSFTGNLTQDIEVFVTKNGKSGAKIKVACNDRKKVGNDWVDGDTIYLTGIVWGDTAENAVISLSKGDTVTCTGRLTQRSYTGKDNVEKTVYEVNIDSLAADLRRTPYNKLGVKRVTQAPAEHDVWSAPLSDNSTGVNF